MSRRDASLLAQIEDDVLSDKSLADTLRKCVVLGGKAGSRDLREWATRELKGYGDDDEVPAYRTVGAPILADAVTGSAWVKRQRIGTFMLPDFVRDKVKETFTFRQGVGLLEAMIEQSEDKGYGSTHPVTVHDGVALADGREPCSASAGGCAVDARRHLGP